MRYNDDVKEGMIVEKTATLNLRVNPIVKERAEEVLNQLGIPMSIAIDMYLNQISMTGGIPFAISLPKPSPNINIEGMTDDELLNKLKQGLNDVKNGNVEDAQIAFDKFKRKVKREKI